MKKFTFLLFTLFASLLLNNPIFAQWVRANGPYGGFVGCIAVSDTSVYAGTYNGLFQLNLHSESWVDKNKMLKDLITAVAISDSDIYAGTWINGIYLSTDYGDTWTAINHGLPKNFGTVSLVFSGNDLFLGARFSGVYLSSDKGRNWKSVNEGLTDSLAILTLTVADSSIFAGTDHGIFLSVNKGKSWKAMNSGIPANVGVHSIVVLDSLIYLGTDDGVYRSDDNGESWMPFGSGLPDHSKIFSLAALGNNLYAGTRSYGIYVLPDTGNTWKAVNTGLPYKTDFSAITSLAVSGTTLYAGTNNAGLYLSTNGGKAWNASNKGLRGVYINAVLSAGTNLLAAGNDLFLSVDKGNTWEHKVSATQITAMVRGGNNIYAGYNGGIFRSTDNGKNWQQVLSAPFISLLAASDSNVLIATTTNKLYLSNNYGNSWEKLSDSIDVPDNAWVSSVAIAGSYYLLGTNRGVFYSNDNGKNWMTAKGLPPVSSIVAEGSKVYAAVMSGHGVYISDDNGQNWQHVGPDSTSNYGIYSLGTVDSVVLATSFSHGLFLLTDNGNHWTSISGNLPDSLFVPSLCGFNSEVYVATGFEGLWHRPLSDILTEVEQLPNRDPLLQLRNYPNPFGGETNIVYSLPVAGHVNLTVYNSAGQKVTTLVSKLQEAGDYSVKWNGKNFPEGIYYYQILLEDSRNYSQTKKMVLIK